MKGAAAGRGAFAGGVGVVNDGVELPPASQQTWGEPAAVTGSVWQIVEEAEQGG